MTRPTHSNQSGWPSGLRRCVQVAVYSCRRGFKSHFWQIVFCILQLVRPQNNRNNCFHAFALLKIIAHDHIKLIIHGGHTALSFSLQAILEGTSWIPISIAYKHTFKMGASESIPILEKPHHNHLPVSVDVIKISWLSRQLFPDVFTQKDVLQQQVVALAIIWKTKSISKWNPAIK